MMLFFEEQLDPETIQGFEVVDFLLALDAAEMKLYPLQYPEMFLYPDLFFWINFPFPSTILLAEAICSFPGWSDPK